MLKKYLIYFIQIVFILVASSLAACSWGSRETQPTQTAQAERAIRQATQIVRSRQATQAAAERSLVATAQAARELAAFQWPQTMADEFDNNLNDWALGEEQDPSLASITWNIDAGVYRWEARAVEPFIWWVSPTLDSIVDFYLSIEARQIDGPDTGEFGLLFRRDEELGYYLYEISASQQFSVSRYDYASESWTTLLDWQPSAALRAGWANSLAVVGQTDRFYFFANDERVAEIQDSAIPAGAVGLVVGLSSPGDEAAWEFDRFELRTPILQTGEATQTPTPQE